MVIRSRMKLICILLHGLLALTVHAKDDGVNQSSETDIEKGVFEPSWQSLSANYEAPQWFANAKLGIWAHWGLQCVPEDGDWYARSMYQQDQARYRNHCKRYGHPQVETLEQALG